jgi:isopenicillin N synthase-like dioxygenase
MVPIINFSISTLEKQMEDAYTTCGFAVFTNVYDSWLSEFSDWQQIMEEYFKQKNETKIKYKHTEVYDNLGYNSYEK